LTGKSAARRSLGGLVLTALLTAGCGVRPSGVITGGAAPTWPGKVGPPRSAPPDAVRLYLIANGGLTWVLRPTGHPLSPTETLALLAGGPDAAERASGFTSEVPSDAAPIGVTSGPSGLTVTLARDVSTLSATAVEQIVCTAQTAQTAPATGGEAAAPAPVTVLGQGRRRGPDACP
jgi:hypothetical protein